MKVLDRVRFRVGGEVLVGDIEVVEVSLVSI
jgi:hypothetical protein